jgi:hypothetical protein
MASSKLHVSEVGRTLLALDLEVVSIRAIEEHVDWQPKTTKL